VTNASPINTRQRVAIAHPEATLESLQTAVLNLKEAVEILMQQRGHSDDWAVRWSDLIRLGLVKPGQEPEGVRGGALRRGGSDV
jgi:hypothetical protein